jgi:hypothetical protein
LWIVGHAATLSWRSPWSDLIANAQKRGFFVSKEKHRIVLDDASALTQAKHIVATSRPSKSADLFGDSPWNVVVSNKALVAIQKLTDKLLIQEVMKRLLFLSQGKRPKRSRSSVHTKSERGKQLIQEFEMNNGFSILWTVDIDRAHKKQMLKVWDFVTNSSIAVSVMMIERTLKNYSPGYTQLCAEIGPKNGDIVLPMEFSEDRIKSTPVTGGSTTEGVHVEARMQEECSVEDSFLLMKFYTISTHIARMIGSGKNIFRIFFFIPILLLHPQCLWFSFISFRCGPPIQS